MKLLLTAGGGGHFAPLLAVLQALPKDVDVRIAGRKFAFEGERAISLEYLTAKSLGIPFTAITSTRLQRTFTRYTILALLKLPVGFWQGILLMRRYKPDAVVSFGGTVTLPVTLSAFLFRIPVIIHEQTLGAGLSNRIEAIFAKKVCISWESSTRFFPKEKTVLTGNPIRKEILRYKVEKREQTKEELPTLYITGGSLGSHALNVLIEDSLATLISHCRIFHQTGDANEYHDYEKLLAKKQTLPHKLQERYTLVKFVPPSDVGKMLHEATLVVARSGMNTVSELISLSKPALLIPFPHAQGNEQLQNALFFKDSGLGDVLSQYDVTPQTFERKVIDMLSNIGAYQPKNDIVFPHDAQMIIAVVMDTVPHA